MPLTMVYPLWVFGEGDQTFVPLLADAIIKKELIFWRKGAIVWPTYIDNLVDLLMLISEDERAIGNGYLVHDGESTTLEDFCTGIAVAAIIFSALLLLEQHLHKRIGPCLELGKREVAAVHVVRIDGDGRDAEFIG